MPEPYRDPNQKRSKPGRKHNMQRKHQKTLRDERRRKKKHMKRSKWLSNTDPEATLFHLILKYNIHPHYVSHSNQEIKTKDYGLYNPL